MTRLVTIAVRITFASLGAFTLSLAFLPDPKTAVADPWLNAPTSLIVKAPPRLPDALGLIARDPFHGGPNDTQKSPNPNPTNTAAEPANNSNIVGIRIPQMPAGTNDTFIPPPGTVPNPGGLLPQNGAASEKVDLIGTVVGGGHAPVAMISDGQHVDFAHVGDTINGKPIIAIVERGIELSDGSRLAIAPSSNPNPTTAPSKPEPAGAATPVETTHPASPLAPPITILASPSTSNTIQTPFGGVNPAAAPTIQPGNYSGAPPTLGPNQTAAPLPHYVAPN